MDRRSPRNLSETILVQNPALGAYALWQFGLAYQANGGRQAILPLSFLVLPIIFHKATQEIVSATHKSSGLRLFVGKLSEKREILLALHDRTKLLRELSFESIVLGEAAALLSLDEKHALIRANTLSEDMKIPKIPTRLKWLTPACEKLGYWFSSHTDHQVISMLKVEL
ncbi:MAG: hypothetical protein KG003_12445 [Bacteroidetes bacterium]|nr:hypothetical protein [Bacteroidota bacterium]